MFHSLASRNKRLISSELTYFHSGVLGQKVK